MHPTDDLEKVLGFNWVYEPEVVSAILNLAEEGDFCIDAGACIGYHSLLMSRRVGPVGAVMAFEPDPRTQKKIEANILLNNIGNILVMPMPLLDKVAEFQFFSYPNLCGYSSFMGYKDMPCDPLMLRTNYLDNIFDDECQIKLLKIDCEGVEDKILHGAERLMRGGKIDNVIVEFNFKILRQLEERHYLSDWAMREFMADCGYNCFFLFQSGMPPALLPRGFKIELNSERFHYNFLFSRKESFPEWKSWSLKKPVWISPYDFPVEYAGS